MKEFTIRLRKNHMMKYCEYLYIWCHHYSIVYNDATKINIVYNTVNSYVIGLVLLGKSTPETHGFLPFFVWGLNQ